LNLAIFEKLSIILKYSGRGGPSMEDLISMLMSATFNESTLSFSLDFLPKVHVYQSQILSLSFRSSSSTFNPSRLRLERTETGG